MSDKASSVLLTVAGDMDLSELEGKTFQVHVLPGGRMLKLCLVTLPAMDDRCQVIVGGERCGCKAGHDGKHMWAGGD